MTEERRVEVSGGRGRWMLDVLVHRSGGHVQLLIGQIVLNLSNLGLLPEDLSCEHELATRTTTMRLGNEQILLRKLSGQPIIHTLFLFSPSPRQEDLSANFNTYQKVLIVLDTIIIRNNQQNLPKSLR